MATRQRRAAAKPSAPATQPDKVPVCVPCQQASPIGVVSCEERPVEGIVYCTVCGGEGAVSFHFARLGAPLDDPAWSNVPVETGD